MFQNNFVALNLTRNESWYTGLQIPIHRLSHGGSNITLHTAEKVQSLAVMAKLYAELNPETWNRNIARCILKNHKLKL